MTSEIPLTEGVYYILLTLHKPNHGYGIIQEVQTLTNNRLVLGAGTLYGALNTMMEKGWIQLYSEDKSSRKKKEYIITEKGSKIVLAEILRLQELVTHGKEMMEVNKNETL